VKGLIWLTWRQHRWPIVVSTVITAVVFVFMLVTAADLASMAHKCLTAPAGQCQRAQTESTPSHAQYLMNTVVFLPVLVAVFWGVPLLAREFEQRTLPLAWSQDVSRLKWLAGKTGVMIVLIAAMGTALAAASVHLAYEYHAYTSTSLFDGTPFQAGGWLPLTLGLAWLAVGIAAGAATRRVLVAIAVVGGLWIVRMVGMIQLRPRFMTPVSNIKPLAFGKPPRSGPSFDFSNDMSITSDSLVDIHGATHPEPQVMDDWCGSADDQSACVHQHGILGHLVKYQPANRMGTFHLIENSMNLALFVIGLVVAWWCVKKARTTVG
jgi:hypothetical protein